MSAHRSWVIGAAIALVASCGPSSTAGHGLLVGLEIEPANATLTYTGAPLAQTYTAVGRYEDGSTQPVPDAVFALDADGARLGDLAAAELAVHGRAAGKGGVYATVGEIVGSTSVIVVVHRTDLGPGVPADGADRFPDTSPIDAESATVVYPLDGAIMPTSVKSPNVQWESTSNVDDLYRVRVQAGFATIDTIVTVATGSGFNAQLGAADWQLLVDSAGLGAVTTSVDHWNATTGAHGGAPITVKLVDANITGAIYYWNLAAGRMERIDANGRALAMENPPPRPSDNKQCVACHTVSKDGRYLSGSLWDGGQQGAVFDMSDPNVLTANPAPTVTPLSMSTYTSLFSTFNPDASRLLVNVVTRLELRDPKTGLLIPTNGTPLPATGVAHPTWSPDGSTIAFVGNITNGGAAATWAVDYDRGDLQTLSATAGDTFGPQTTLVGAGTVDAAYAAPSWPSFAPDSTWLAYGAGVFSRGKNGATEHPGALFIVNKAGGVTRRLDTACDGAHRCYLPNFSPYDAGGYFWLVYYSFRDYGNTQAGTKGTGRRQLWITAIDKAKLAAGGDPSSVPYWLPDQDRLTENMSAFWALPAPLQ